MLGVPPHTGIYCEPSLDLGLDDPGKRLPHKLGGTEPDSDDPDTLLPHDKLGGIEQDEQLLPDHLVGNLGFPRSLGFPQGMDRAALPSALSTVNIAWVNISLVRSLASSMIGAI
jgi:hypothetical protein